MSPRATDRNTVHVEYPPNVLVTCDAGHSEMVPPAKADVGLRCSVLACDQRLRVVSEATRARRAKAELTKALLEASA